MKMKLLPKQRAFAAAMQNPRYHTGLWAASVRAGKSYGMCLSLAGIMTSRPRSYTFGIMGYSLGAIERNLLPYIRSICNDFGWSYRERLSAPSYVEIEGRRAYLFGATTKASAEAVAGYTTGAFFIDEAPRLPVDVVQLALSRNSLPQAKVMMSANKTGPAHWFKREHWDQRNRRIFRVESTLEENTFITEDAKETIKDSLHGTQRKRLLDNEWAAATGLIYPYELVQGAVWAAPEDLREVERVEIGADYGAASTTAAVIMGKTGDEWVVLDEYYHRAEEGELRVSEHAGRILEVAKRWGEPKIAVTDPSAPVMAQEFRHLGLKSVRVEERDVDKGIQHVTRRLGNGRLQIADRCVSLLAELDTYEWLPETDRQPARPLKRYDHACDALRYWVVARDLKQRVTGQMATVNLWGT